MRLLFCISIALHAQVFSITGPASLLPNQPFTFNVAVTAPPGGWSAAAFTVSCTNCTMTAPGAPVSGPSPIAAVEFVTSQVGITGASVNALVAGVNIPNPGCLPIDVSAPAVTMNGPIATFSATSQGPIPIVLTVSNVSMGTPAGLGVPGVTGATVTIPVVPLGGFCDVGGYGSPNLQDALLELSWLFGSATPPAGQSANRQGGAHAAADMTDEEIVWNWVLGGPCTATQ